VVIFYFSKNNSVPAGAGVLVLRFRPQKINSKKPQGKTVMPISVELQTVIAVCKYIQIYLISKGVPRPL
jgi:hypothetical protein